MSSSISFVGTPIPGCTNADGTPYIFSIQDEINAGIAEDEVRRIRRTREPRLFKSDVELLRRLKDRSVLETHQPLVCRSRADEKAWLKLLHAGIVVRDQLGYFVCWSRVPSRDCFAVFA
jgi:hypothetical protein